MNHKKQYFNVDNEFNKKTISHFLKKQLTDYAWSKVKLLVEGGHIFIDGNVASNSTQRLKGGEKVCIDLNTTGRKYSLPSQHKQVPSPNNAIEIIHLDQHIVVVNKPAGITTMRHPYEAAEFGDKARFLPKTVAEMLPRLIVEREGEKKRRGTVAPVKAVHRLDKETSGILVFARTDKAASSLGKQFRAHSIVRKYRALVIGTITSRQIKTLIARDRGDGIRGSNPTRGKTAITNVVTLEELSGYTLLECILETGRTHQIRIHLAEAGSPVCGEKVYLKRFKKKKFIDTSGAQSLMLHATELGFVHPGSLKHIQFTSLPPKFFLSLLSKLRKSI